MLQIIRDLITLVALLVGLFFMSVGALGVWRLPDVYNRMHASSKCITLGIIGLLLAAALHLSIRFPQGTLDVLTTSALVIIFQFVAAPVGSHMLAKAAHLDGAPLYERTVADDLAQDKRAGEEVKG